MEAYYEILSQCPLFAGITRQEMPEILNCLDKKVVEIPKGDPVFLEGEPARFVGVVLSGGVQIVRDDYYGNRSVLTVVAPGGMFAEAFVCAGLDALPVSAFAVQSSTVLLLDCSRVMTGCGHDCLFHSRLVYNLCRASLRKSGADGEDTVHVPENDPGKADGIFSRSGEAPRQRGVYDPL